MAESYGKDIKVAVHYTNIEDNDQIDTMAANLKDASVDYDMFGLSVLILDQFCYVLHIFVGSDRKSVV